MEDDRQYGKVDAFSTLLRGVQGWMVPVYAFPDALRLLRLGRPIFGRDVGPARFEEWCAELRRMGIDV